MKAIIPIGISGSGKSKLYKDKYSNIKKICPDDIRFELTGNISDQSKNKQVFEMADKLAEDAIKNNEDFFFDATNLNTKLRVQMVNKFKKLNPRIEIVYEILPADIDLSFKRITNDIKNSVNRSNVPYDVLIRQYQMYSETMKQDFCNEGARIVFYP